MNTFLGLIIVSLVVATRGNPHHETVKIVGGESAPISTVPWMVALLPGSGLCGASLIAPQWILTAASCVKDVSTATLFARLGSNFYNSGGHTATFSHIKIHSHYNSELSTNDVALLKISTPLTYSSTIHAINLPTAIPFFQNLTGLEARILGYGTTSSGGSLSSNLHTAMVNIKNQSQCQNAYGSLYNSTINLCAGAPGKDVCQGDTGGPMSVTDSNGVPHQVGIASWGFGCANANYPTVYTKVSHFVDWIWATVNTN